MRDDYFLYRLFISPLATAAKIYAAARTVKRMEHRRPEKCVCCGMFDDVSLVCLGCQKQLCTACFAEHGIAEMFCRRTQWRCTHKMTRFQKQRFHDY